MNEKAFIFIDEFGNSSIKTEKQGSFSHQIYTAIIISESNLLKARELRDIISTNYFSGKDIKSSDIRNNDRGFRRRLKILKELLELDFGILTLVINKAELSGKGFNYKRSFIKYFERIFVKELAKNFSAFEIYSDNKGTLEYQQSLKEFVRQQSFQTNLFDQNKYYTVVDDIKDEKLVQLADFLSGCIGKIFCSSHIHPKANELADLLKNKLNVEHFPYQKIEYHGNLPENHLDIDEKISKIALDKANSFLELHRHNPHYSKEILKLNLLSFHLTPDRLVSKSDILEYLKIFDKDVNESTIKSAIDYLRKNDVLITSIKGKYGYKIPNCLNDLYGYYNRLLDNIVPMLNRINKSHQLLNISSMNKVNIFELDDSYRLLRELLRVMDEYQNL
jgi:uncharacterized protein DUF3800